MSSKQAYTLREVAEMVDSSYWRVYRDLSVGRLIASKIQGRWLVTDDDCEKYVADVRRHANEIDTKAFAEIWNSSGALDPLPGPFWEWLFSMIRDDQMDRVLGLAPQDLVDTSLSEEDHFLAACLLINAKLHGGELTLESATPIIQDLVHAIPESLLTRMEAVIGTLKTNNSLPNPRNRN